MTSDSKRSPVVMNAPPDSIIKDVGIGRARHDKNADAKMITLP
jgi:hypothetical protein